VTKRLILMLCLLAGPILSGCVPILIGGAAVGGYYLGQDERSAARIAEDSAITTRVKTRFVGDKYVDALAIDVDTWEGVVTLHGAVATRFEREQAEKLASTVSGVQRVDNRIRVLPPEAGPDSARTEDKT
jgi:hyperosmotically inducible protein